MPIEPILSHRLITFLAVIAVAAAPALAKAASSPRNPGQQKSAVCDPEAYGAKADGKANDTKALQKAIDVCAANGGGTVLLKKGSFLTGPLILKSHITLKIDSGATLLGSPNHSDYLPMKVFRQEAVEPLLRTEHADDIRITGGGTIDGNGQAWWKTINGRKSRHQLPVVERPRLLVFDHSTGITLDNIHVENAASWQIIPYYSNDVNIHNIQITAPVYGPNTDGIDVFSSHNVRISHVLIDTGDDDIAIKSGQPHSPGPDRPSSDITITDSTFLHGHGMSIGSELSGGAQNVRVSHIQFKGTEHGIRIKCQRGRGGDIGNFTFDDITMRGVEDPLIVSDFYSGKPANLEPEPVNRLTPKIHDVRVKNLTATGARSAGVIEGLPEAPIERMELDNVHIEAERGMRIANATVTAHHLVIQVASGQPVTLGKNGILHKN